MNRLRAALGEVTMLNAKFSAPPAPIDFAAYKAKLDPEIVAGFEKESFFPPRGVPSTVRKVHSKGRVVLFSAIRVLSCGGTCKISLQSRARASVVRKTRRESPRKGQHGIAPLLASQSRYTKSVTRERERERRKRDSRERESEGRGGENYEHESVWQVQRVHVPRVHDSRRRQSRARTRRLALSGVVFQIKNANGCAPVTARGGGRLKTRKIARSLESRFFPERSVVSLAQVRQALR